MTQENVSITPTASIRPEVIVRTLSQLHAVCRDLGAAGSFGIDTEFVRERTYYIRLGIIQVATAEGSVIIDPQLLETLQPFFELVSDPAVEKIVHAGEQDFAVLFERSGKPPRNVFDTQIAAALVGYGDQVSYAKLVEKVTGVRLSKLQTLTDWMERPLTEAQIDYAREDVRYLSALKENLSNRLKELGREAWAREEFRYLEQADAYAPSEPRQLYKRIKVGDMDGARLGVLREVAAWREEEAMRRDIPRGWVMRDQTAAEIARRKPASIPDLRAIRSLNFRELERRGTQILAAVRRGLSKPVREDLRTVPRGRDRSKPLARLLEAWVHTRATEAQIAPSLLASREQLKALAAGQLDGESARLPVLEGWRRELVGQDLLDILGGKLRLEVDPTTGEIVAQRP